MTITLHARAALLDMDGTLVDSTAVVERVWLDWARPHGLDPALVLATVHGRQGHESMALLLPDRDHSINIAENVALLQRETENLTGVVPIPGSADLLAALGPFRHAIVTSADVALMKGRMGEARLTIPALAITAESVSRSKPDPEGFLLGASELGVDPADCIVFEDSEAGIRAGLDAGMTVIGVGRHAPAFGPTHHVDDLASVRITAAGDGFDVTLG